jgi:hypothetical protein
MTINCDYSKHGVHRFGKCCEYNLEPRRLLTKVDVTAVAVSIIASNRIIHACTPSKTHCEFEKKRTLYYRSNSIIPRLSGITNRKFPL